jgi:hypothetical protein
MADQSVDVSQEILNRLDNEIRDLTKLIFEVQGIILTLKFLSQRLRENQGAFTKH